MSTPTTIAALIAGVLDRLEAKYPTYDVQAYPDKPESYRLINQNGAFLVAYRGADYGDVESEDVITNARLMLIDVHVVAHNLNGDGGATAALELARVALVGLKLPGFTKLAPVRERFVGRTETNWVYALTLHTGTVAIEVDDDDAPVGTLQTVTAVSDYGTTQEP